MLNNININFESRTFIFKLLEMYSGCLANLCKIWEISCQLFVRLLEPFTNIENVPVAPTEQLHPSEVSNEINSSLTKRNVCESQLPAVKQNISPEAKVETPSEHAKAAKRVEAPAETMKQVSTEAKHVTAAEADGGNEINSNISEAELKPLKLKSIPPVEETKPFKVKHETTSEPLVETHKQTEVVSTSNGEVVSPTPSVVKEHINSSSSSEGVSKSSTRETS
ncbi:MAG: hypothetical protein ACTS4V_01555 [Candidatus Hodgkinia cicadicola]